MISKILILNDTMPGAVKLDAILQKAGYLVSNAAGTVKEAKYIIDVEQPDCVLIDTFHQSLNTSIDWAMCLNKKDIPYIYLADQYDESMLKAMGDTSPFGFLFKPLREKDLLGTLAITKLRQQLNRSSEARSKNTETKIGQKANDSDSESMHPGSKNAHDIIEIPQSSQVRKHFPGIVGESRQLRLVLDQITQVAAYNSTVLILGETGVGKEGIAAAIHQKSHRSSQPFIKVNCAAIPEQLMESELFGHERGAFTGAHDRRIGKFELANGGTLFLDEIGEMPLEMQCKLLRVLQEREVERIGGTAVIKTDVRIIAATNRNLQKDIEAGKFRQDLYFRLNVFPIVVPALRERREDIAALALHFLKKHSLKTGKRVTGISAEALNRLSTYAWPGNVRELEHLIERSILSAADSVIKNVYLPTGSEQDLVRDSHPRIKTIDEVDRDHILFVLNECQGRVAGSGGAAEALQMPSTTLHSKIKRLGIVKRF